ncbi:MAG: hypothetical protein ABFC78_10035 [Methanoregula sp.]
MDDLVVSGVIALVLFYAGIVIVAYAILRLFMMMVHAFFSGDFLLFGAIIGCIVVASVGYVAVGLWLRKMGTI